MSGNLLTPEEYVSLVKRLIDYSDSYYNLSDPDVSDDEYDYLYDKISEFEKLNPDLVDPLSPTQNVGAKLPSNRSVLHHKTRMSSLANVKNENELREWVSGLRVFGKFVCSPKFDGISLNLIYEGGSLLNALTRGDGVTGQIVTRNALRIGSIPRDIPYMDFIEIRGEVVLTRQNFDLINAKRSSLGLRSFVNPRNAASGLMYQIENNLDDISYLEFIPWGIGHDSNLGFNSFYSSINALGSFGFNGARDYFKLCDTVDSVIEEYFSMLHSRDSYEMMLDGMVVMLDDMSLAKDLGFIGFNSKYPKYARAYKFPSLEKEVVIRDVTHQVGRTGVLTPVANFDAVNIGGANVSRATLHNYTEIERLDLCINDIAIVVRSCDVIPKITKVLARGERADRVSVAGPTVCPSCALELDYEITYKVEYKIATDVCLEEEVALPEGGVSSINDLILGLAGEFLTSFAGDITAKPVDLPCNFIPAFSTANQSNSNSYLPDSKENLLSRVRHLVFTNLISRVREDVFKDLRSFISSEIFSIFGEKIFRLMLISATRELKNRVYLKTDRDVERFVKNKIRYKIRRDIPRDTKLCIKRFLERELLLLFNRTVLFDADGDIVHEILDYIGDKGDLYSSVTEESFKTVSNYQFKSKPHDTEGFDLEIRDLADGVMKRVLRTMLSKIRSRLAKRSIEPAVASIISRFGVMPSALESTLHKTLGKVEYLIHKLVSVRCNNIMCSARVRDSISHFVSKNAMDIDWFGKKLVDKLCDMGILSNALDIFRLTEADLLMVDGFQKKSAGNVINSIRSVVGNRELWRFIYSLGIPLIGEVASKRIALLGIDRFIDVDLKAEKLPDFGSKMIGSYCSFMARNASFVRDLLHTVKPFESKDGSFSTAKPTRFANKVCVITGNFDIPRHKLESRLLSMGASIAKTISKNTDLLLVGDKPGSAKLNKVKDLNNVVLLYKDDLVDILSGFIED